MPIPFERLVRLDFGPHPDRPAEVSLMCEIQGQYSNVVMVDGKDDTVLLAARQIGKGQTAVRSVKVGAPYMNPPPAPGLLPSSNREIEVWTSNIMQTSSQLALRSGQEAPTAAIALSHTFQGVSRSLGRQLCIRAGLSPEVVADDMTSEEWQTMHKEWVDWLDTIEQPSKTFKATKCGATGSISVLGTFAEPCESVQGSVGSLYASVQAAERFDQLKSTLQRAVKTAHKKLKGKIAALEKQKSIAVEAETTQKLADLFMANVYQWPKSGSELQVDDWETGEPVLLVIRDENVGPVQYAEKLYKKAAKQRRAVEQLQPLLDAARSQLEYIEDVSTDISLLDRMDDIQDLRALQEVQDEMVSQGLMKAPADAKIASRSKAQARKQAKRKRSPSAGGSNSPYRVYASPSGFQILIGRNHTQNDALSTKIAQDKDVWMHARQQPGSHLVMRIPAGSSPAQEDLQYAANLSVYFSKAKESGKCDVTMCSGKDVRKPKGAKPGQVLVQNEKVLAGYPGKSAAALEEKNF